MDNLQALLQRIGTDESVKPTEEPPKPTEELYILLDRVENSKWRDQKIQEVLERLEGLYGELRFIRHIRRCKNCQFELAIDVTRYGGNHSGLWFIDLSNDDVLPEIYEGCPPARNYHWGSYWNGENPKEAVRFILDRAKWAEPIIQREIHTVIDFYLALESWDLKSPLPTETTDELLFRD